MIPYETYTKIPIHIKLVTPIPIFSLHACYAYGTQSKSEIHINNTYMYTQNGGTEFMVIDDNGKHYNVNNSFWYWKWNSIEDWHNIKPGDVLNVKYYGIRIPLFGVFPNIVCTRSEPFKPEPTFMEINNINTINNIITS
jgi:hypothetical protein